VTEGSRIVLVAFIALAAGFTWQSVKTTLIPPSSPERLIGELRLAQLAALLLVLTAGAYVGFAVTHEALQGVGFDVAFAIGFLVLAAATMVYDPRQALTVLALGFAAHAVLDVAHRPDSFLPEAIAPRWYFMWCAIYNVFVGALCYLPVFKR
jgi:hypothetical protein